MLLIFCYTNKATRIGPQNILLKFKCLTACLDQVQICFLIKSSKIFNVQESQHQSYLWMMSIAKNNNITKNIFQVFWVEEDMLSI